MRYTIWLLVDGQWRDCGYLEGLAAVQAKVAELRGYGLTVKYEEVGQWPN